MGNHKRVLVKVEVKASNPMMMNPKMVLALVPFLVLVLVMNWTKTQMELVVEMAKKTLKRAKRVTLVNILLTHLGQKKQTNRHLLKALQIVTNQSLSGKFGMPKMRI
jgi:L-lactate permease